VVLGKNVPGRYKSDNVVLRDGNFTSQREKRIHWHSHGFEAIERRKGEKKGKKSDSPSFGGKGKSKINVAEKEGEDREEGWTFFSWRGERKEKRDLHRKKNRKENYPTPPFPGRKDHLREKGRAPLGGQRSRREGKEGKGFAMSANCEKRDLLSLLLLQDLRPLWEKGKTGYLPQRLSAKEGN